MRSFAFLLSILILSFGSSAQVSREAAELTETGIRHYESGNFAIALEKLTKAIDVSSKPKAASKVKQSALTATPETDLLDRITFHDPITGIAFLNRGHVQFARMKMELAIADYTEAIRIAPGSKEAYTSRSRAYMLNGQNQRAIDDAKRAIKIDPSFAGAHIALGMAYHNAGRTKEALACADKAIEVDPESAEAYFRRGDFLRLADRSTEAMADYGRAMKLDPDFASPYIGRGAINFEQKRYEAAIADYTIALDIDHRLLQALRYRGYAYLALGRDDEAERDFAKAVAVAPGMREEIETTSAQIRRRRQL
jgi:tetratricopeptide (TPR) repeat protein